MSGQRIELRSVVSKGATYSVREAMIYRPDQNDIELLITRVKNADAIMSIRYEQDMTPVYENDQVVDYIPKGYKKITFEILEGP